MKVISNPGQIKLKQSAVAIGIFDGLHLGHQLLIKQMVAHAKKFKLTPVVVTFFPHPVHVLRPEIPLAYLMPLEQRLDCLAKLGVKMTLVIRFNKKFALISAQDFIQKTLVGKLKVKSIFVGENFRFGRNRQGDISLFQKLSKENGYCLYPLKTLKKAGDRISSGRLRELIAQGSLKQAQNLLGRPVSVLGYVVKGSSRGKALGFPTANVQYHSQVLPPQGVYAVRVLWNHKSYQGMANLGSRPTFQSSKDSPILFEVHILDFKANLYGQKILVEFLHKLREEMKFPSKEALIRQIVQDEKKVRQLKINP